MDFIHICTLHEADKFDQREGEGEGEGEAVREAERETEAETVHARACAWLSVHLVSLPAVTMSGVQEGGDEREFIGPLLSVEGCVRAHTGGRHAQGHRPRIQTHRRRSRAACDRMRHLPVSQKTHTVSVLSPPPLP